MKYATRKSLRLYWPIFTALLTDAVLGDMVMSPVHFHLIFCGTMKFMQFL